MRSEYDFSNARRNPYAEQLKKQVTIDVDLDTIDYFQLESQNTGVPYLKLINLYLNDCAVNNKKIELIN